MEKQVHKPSPKCQMIFIFGQKCMLSSYKLFKRQEKSCLAQKDDFDQSYDILHTGAFNGAGVMTSRSLVLVQSKPQFIPIKMAEVCRLIRTKFAGIWFTLALCLLIEFDVPWILAFKCLIYVIPYSRNLKKFAERESTWSKVTWNLLFAQRAPLLAVPGSLA